MKAGRTRRFQAFFAFGIDFSAFFGYTINRRDTGSPAVSRNDPVVSYMLRSVSFTFARLSFGIDFPGGIGYNNARRDILRWRQAWVVRNPARCFGDVSITFSAFLSVLTFPAVSVIIILVEAFSVGDKPRSFRTKPAVSEVSLLSRILIGTA